MDVLALVTSRRPPQACSSGAHDRDGRDAACVPSRLLSNLSKSKLGVFFFTSLLPQFGGESFGALLALALVFCTMTFVWLTAYAAAVARAGDVLRRPAIRRVLDAVAGGVLVSLGLRLATERR